MKQYAVYYIVYQHCLFYTGRHPQITERENAYQKNRPSSGIPVKNEQREENAH